MFNEDKIIAIYCFVDDFLKGIGHYEPTNRKLSDSELITTTIVSTLYFGGHWDNAKGFMKIIKLMPQMLDKSPLP